MNSIFDLMRVSDDDRDDAWLKEALLAAIQLELSTLPPYLTAMWSIKDSGSPVRTTIREVIMEEMTHMGLACNLLVAIGGHTQINLPNNVPVFPGPLPGDVHPGLEVSLACLSCHSIQTFMEIEYPQHGPVAKIEKSYPTIGDFYIAILERFETLDPDLDTSRQYVGSPGIFEVSTLDLVRNAIETIMEQGEGSAISPEEKPGDLAHYYRFGEVFYGKRLVKDAATGKWAYNGPPVAMPDVHPMANIPVGGYQQSDVDPAVWDKIELFDDIYTQMLEQLQAVWESNASISPATTSMRRLQFVAQSLMRMQIPGTDLTYGPCWRFTGTDVSEASRK